MKRKKKMYVISKELYSAIEEARVQYRKGEIFTNEEVDREIEKWLKE
jgi:hypothetical protein